MQIRLWDCEMNGQESFMRILSNYRKVCLIGNKKEMKIVKYYKNKKGK